MAPASRPTSFSSWPSATARRGALNDVLREHGRLPGFGHAVYKSGDARFDALLTLAEPLLSEERRAILREVVALAAAHDVPLANCDLALAALSWGTGMPPDTGRTSSPWRASRGGRPTTWRS